MALAVRALSPVTIITVSPRDCRARTACALSLRTASAQAIMPATFSPRRTTRAVLPASAQACATVCMASVTSLRLRAAPMLPISQRTPETVAATLVWCCEKSEA